MRRRYGIFSDLKTLEWILEDIGQKIDPSQFGSRKGTGTEHLIVSYVDRVLKLLDSQRGKSAVIAAAFDRVDPTLAITKFIQMGLRPSLILILISYMTDRKMIVKFRNEQSKPHDLVGGGPQGTLLGQIEYLVASNDCLVKKTSKTYRFKYFDDLHIVEFLLLCNQLVEYNLMEHIPSDIPVENKFLSPNSFEMQSTLDNISEWTEENLMKINESKSKYIIYSRVQQPYSTRLSLNNVTLERLQAIKILGVWVQEDLNWETNTKQLCKSAFSRISILSKLKYTGVKKEDLLLVYKMFIRSIPEYCSVVFTSSLTNEQSQKLEAIQSTSLRIILGDDYHSYDSALQEVGLERLSDRRKKRMESFAIKCVKKTTL